MARRYARGGDEVVWFNSTYWHTKAISRYDRSVNVDIEPGLTIVGLHAPPYERKISFGRLRHNWLTGREFRKISRQLARPDVIVASMPLPELAYEATLCGKRWGVPVVIDIRDFWPDSWLEAVPAFARPLARLALAPYYRKLRKAIDASVAVSGVSEDAVDWGLGLGTRARTEFDGALPLAHEQTDLSEDALRKADQFWDETGIYRAADALTVSYFGNISKRYEFDAVFDAVESLPESFRARLKVVICGVGERYEELKCRALRSNATIVMPGWMDAAQIETLMRRSQIGLLPYPSSLDYTRSMPNKFFDYIGGGLPILSSLKGVSGDYVREQGCGWLYENNDARGLAKLIERLDRDRGAIAAAAERSRAASETFSAARVYGDFHRRLVAMCRPNEVRRRQPANVG